MRPVLSLFAFGTARPVERGVHLYFSPDNVIVAATHRNDAGIYYEQPGAVLVPGRPSAAELGAAFRSAFDAFSIRDRAMRDARMTDWPAFQASGLKTVKAFRHAYRTMLCYGLNPSNAVVRAGMSHPTEEGIELSVSFNPLSPPEEVGASLLRLAGAAGAA